MDSIPFHADTPSRQPTCSECAPPSGQPHTEHLPFGVPNTRAGKQLWARRGVTVLEWIGTPEARRALEGLARGGPRLFTTREAQAALRRLARRSPAPCVLVEPLREPQRSSL